MARWTSSIVATIVISAGLIGSCDDEDAPPKDDAGTVIQCGGDRGDCPGTACTDGSSCAGGACVDGVCCNARCGENDLGDCQACTAALTGEPDGTCAPLESGTVCRNSGGMCDLLEVCDGSSPACPGDVVLPVNFPCRPVAGECDAQEVCDGASKTCPINGFAAATTMCRAQAGPCDVADFCSGSSATCANSIRLANHLCNPSSGDVCDAPDYCNGVTIDCPRAYLVDVECRPPNGACDLAELCSGASPSCPPNDVVSAGIVCRASVNTSCDPAESCDGVSAGCPTNQETCP